LSEPHREDLTALERVLTALQPAAPQLDRDRILFEAGRASARGRFWPAAAALLALVSAGLGGALWWRPVPAERVVLVPVPAPAPPEQVAAVPAPRPEPPAAGPAWPDGEQSRFGSQRLTRDALRWGVDSLPLSPGPTTAAARAPRPADVPTYLQLRTSLRPGGAL
jgi:hypothetical protein